MKKLFKSTTGFTLIELLIVIAVLGVLAAVVLVAIDPLEQFAKGRDAGRKTSVSTLGRSVQALYTTQGTLANLNAAAAGSWLTFLQSTGEIKTIPTAAGGTVLATPCATGNLQGNICYLGQADVC